MAKYLQLDDLDRRTFAALDDNFSDNGEVATVTGEMTVEFVRTPHADGDQYWLTIRFPGGEEFDVKLPRARLLEQLDIGDGDS